MPTNKTQPTAADVAGHVAAIAEPRRRADAEALVALMARASGHRAAMWGTAIVGFGTHRYALAGGRTGEICAVGFASRKADIALYGLVGDDGGAAPAHLAHLGRHKLGKGCLYIARLADVDTAVLERMVQEAAQKRHTVA